MAMSVTPGQDSGQTPAPAGEAPPVKSPADTAERPAPTGRVHWHVAVTHFPISLFGTAFLFQVLHLLMFQTEFERSATVCIVAGAAFMVPAIVTGWITWKRHYHAAKAPLFRRKIMTAFAMLVVSVPLAAWRIALYYLGNKAEGVDHYLFFFFTTSLILGAVIEGHLGGHLSHR